MRRFIFCFLLFTGISNALFSQELVNYHLVTEGTEWTGISVKLGKDQIEARQVAFFVGSLVDFPAGKPNILGKFEIKEKQLSFFPSFGFRPGLSYTLFIKEEMVLQFKIPTDSSPSPRVTAIYPSSLEIPANLLKIYLHFSQPMQAGKSHDWVHLIDDKGDTLNTPFLLLQPELWNENYTRLTLWLDPGRIKRELGPNQERGAPLVPGQEITLSLDQKWSSQAGLALEKGVQKNYQVTVADRNQPIAEKWQLEIPKEGSLAPLKINFQESLDQALAIRSITIESNQQKVLGEKEIKDQDTILEFTPQQAWSAGTYRILIDANLEDLAGNNLNRLFDRDLFDDAQKVREQEFFEIVFEIW